MTPPPMTAAQRIAELQTEINYLRSIVTNERDYEVKQLAADLIDLLVNRVATLKRQQ